MSRLEGKEPFYIAAERFVDAALRHDDSMFTPGTPIWTLTTIEDFYDRFVEQPGEQPGEGDDSYLKKFHRQLAGASPETYQLAGEVLYIHLLIAVGSIGVDAKRHLINTVLRWSPSPVMIHLILIKRLIMGWRKQEYISIRIVPNISGSYSNFCGVGRRCPLINSNMRFMIPGPFTKPCRRYLWVVPICSARLYCILSTRTPFIQSSRATTRKKLPKRSPTSLMIPTRMLINNCSILGSD